MSTAVALQEFRRTGREDFLVFASSLLESMGRKAWPVLRQFARSGSTECELFVGLIARCKDASVKERVAALEELSGNPDLNVRERLFDYLSEIPLADRRSLLQRLSRDPNPLISQHAHEHLAILED